MAASREKPDPFDLRGKVAIVTGGNGGIGLGIARGLADAGANIAIVGRNQTKSSAAVAELEQSGCKAISVVADVTSEGAVTGMVDRVRGELGRIDILVNNAGINIRKPPQTLDLAEWEGVITTNLTSAFLCSRAVHPAMKAAGGGKIINIGSMMSIFGASFAAFDVADEASCRAMIGETAKRFGRLDILVNNAGTSIRKPPQSYTAAEWHAVLDTNLTGAFLCSQAAHPVMKRNGGGKIINIGSMPSSAPRMRPLMPPAKGPSSS